MKFSPRLVARFEASPVTVQKAMHTLVGQGVIETRPGIGTFVRGVPEVRPNDYGRQTAALGSPQHRVPASSAALRTTSNDVTALHSGYPDRERLPERLVRAAFARAARSEAAVGRPPAAGLPELQSWFAAELGAITPTGLAAPAARDVVVLPGSQSGLSTLFRTLVGAGRPLLIESPSYWGAMLAAAQVGVQLVPIRSQSQRVLRSRADHRTSSDEQTVNGCGVDSAPGHVDRKECSCSHDRLRSFFLGGGS